MNRLINTVIQHNNYHIRTFGESMLPILKPNDIVYFTKVPYLNIQVNDIVVFSQKNQLITHRVIYKTPYYLLCKGDNNRQLDGKIKKVQIIGKVEKILRKKQLFNITDIYLLHSSLYLQELDKISKETTRCRIKIITLKGLSLTLWLNKTYPKRLFADWDVLIKLQDLPQFVRILKQLKYRREPNNAYRLIQKFLHKENKEFVYTKVVHGYRINIDTHLEATFLTHHVSVPFGPLQQINQSVTRVLWKNIRQATVNQQHYYFLNNEFLIFYLCLHFFSHNYQGIHRLDFIHQVINKLGRNIDWDKILETGLDLKVVNYILPVFYLLSRYFEFSLPASLQTYPFINHYCWSRQIFHMLHQKNDLFGETQSLFSKRLKRALLIFFLADYGWLSKFTWLINPRLIIHAGYFLLLFIWTRTIKGLRIRKNPTQ